jgi:hypothetical protein
MPSISVPDPVATFIVYGAFLCLCFGQWAIGYFVPQRYRRPSKRRTRRILARVVNAVRAGVVHATRRSTSSATPNTSAILEAPHQPLETP